MSEAKADWIPPVGTSEEWQDPLPLESELPPVESITEELLPISFRPLVRDVAERMQTPADYPAVAAVLGLAGVVNRRAAGVHEVASHHRYDPPAGPDSSRVAPRT